MKTIGLRKLTSFFNKPVFAVEAPLPLVGHIAFGLIDRGTNVVQLRPTTLCPHSCIFCSVDAGPRSVWRQAEYIVDIEWLYQHALSVARYKGGRSLEALLDGVGEPLSHPRVVELVKMLKESGLYERVAIETHGGFLTKSLIMKLADAGLDRINLSIDSLDPAQARRLVGLESYDVSRILELAA
ncbi:MAG: radical SAM protein, partial [Acidilobaceae archaeon]